MSTLESLRGLAARTTVADVVDALGRRHRHRAHILDLVTPTPDRVLFGPAVTMSFFPTCEQRLDPEVYNFASVFYEAAGDDAAGKVLVLAGNGHADVSLGGGVKLSRLAKLGMAGVLADGRLRDFEELAGHGFAAYCRGEATRWGGDVVTPYQANVPVVVGGVGIFPGDYVFASAAGAAVIPAAEVEPVLEGALTIASDDAGHRAAIAAEDLVTARGSEDTRSPGEGELVVPRQD